MAETIKHSCVGQNCQNTPAKTINIPKVLFFINVIIIKVENCIVMII